MMALLGHFTHVWVLGYETHTGFRRLTVVNGTPGFWGVIISDISIKSITPQNPKVC